MSQAPGSTRTWDQKLSRKNSTGCGTKNGTKKTIGKSKRKNKLKPAVPRGFLFDPKPTVLGKVYSLDVWNTLQLTKAHQKELLQSKMGTFLKDRLSKDTLYPKQKNFAQQNQRRL